LYAGLIKRIPDVNSYLERAGRLTQLIELWKKSGYVVNLVEKPTFMVSSVQSEEKVAACSPEINSLAVSKDLIGMAYPKRSFKK